VSEIAAPFDLSWPLFDLLGEAGDWHPKYKY
jgi:hypothetical protein